MSPLGSRRTVARHAFVRSPGPMFQVLRVLSVAVVAVVLSAAAVAGYVAWDLSTSFATEAVELADEPEQPPTMGEYAGSFNVLIAGTDECEPEIADRFADRCSGPDSGGQLNDVNLLIHVSDAPRRVTAISFPRDLMLYIPSCTDEKTGRVSSAMSKQPINSAYGYGGLGCVVDTGVC